MYVHHPRQLPRTAKGPHVTVPQVLIIRLLWGESSQRVMQVVRQRPRVAARACAATLGVPPDQRLEERLRVVALLAACMVNDARSA